MMGSMDRVRNLKQDHRNKFRHPVVNTSQNSKAQCTNLQFFNLTQHLHKQVTIPGILTRPLCATLAGGPLLTQPGKKYMIRSQMQYRLGPNPPMVLRPLSTGSKSRVTLPSMSFGRDPRTGD
ncbi:hypothetical protein M9H77_31998 [Catharanthus roseus]|uniref:Uncharacterized protein n=1 Tax=Catharanthus roseus TaxID=4058 RepID=A0ACC0A5I9_CATRO|nr:hypothetical protein M9H77_31998 [Catharanthus roseus]